MKYLKIFEEFSVIDSLNKKALQDKMSSDETLTLDDVIGGYEIYCGNYTDSDETEICGYSFGEISPDLKKGEFAKKALGHKCPDCNMTIGNITQWVSQEDVDSFEVKLPGEGFYLFSKETEAKMSKPNDSKIESKPLLDKPTEDKPVTNNIDDPGFETPPKWVKNPKSWAMDKIVQLLTPESNIHQIATTFVESGIFSFKDLKDFESSIKDIYQSCKDKKELDVKDHVRVFNQKGKRLSLWDTLDTNKLGKHISKNKDKYNLIHRFENLLGYFQD